MTKTTLEAELKEQQRWPLLERWSKLRVFDDLVRNEFHESAEQQRRHDVDVMSMLRFALTQVPYYRDLGIDNDCTLADFPVLTKQTVRDQRDKLRPTTMPTGDKVATISRTSGTTGQPVEVVRSFRASAMFSLIKQREYRWFRFDPTGTFAMIRCLDEMPKVTEQGLQWAAWPFVSNYYQTGPAVGFDHTKPVDDQADWLAESNPHYLLTEAGDLECLAFGFQQRPVPGNLRGILAISHQLTPQMRNLAERVFGVPVHQNYGLNEIGIVASRCPAGRYHVHTEHCSVEIVDDDGQPCKPGQTGRLLITSLNNVAMPLLRYDADDLAVVADAPCPCGRTLPSFAEIVGRYRRLAFLPPDTWAYWQAFRVAVEQMPGELSAPLRQYQLHQFNDGRFEMRVAAVQPISQAFCDYVLSSWRSGPAGEDVRLSIVQVDQIPVGPGRKLQNFTSDFSPDPDVDVPVPDHVTV